jgi:hypothetical protein
MNKAALITLSLWLMVSCLACWDDSESQDQTALVMDFFQTYKTDLAVRAGEGLFNGNHYAIEEAAAALGAYSVIDNLFQADKLMDEGRREEDPAKMDQAIKMRPDDWTYRTSRAALALQRGEMITYSIESNAADTLVNHNEISPTLYARQQVNNLEYVESRLRITGFKREQCEMLYASLQLQYEKLVELTLDPAYDTRAKWAADKLAGCQDIPE